MRKEVKIIRINSGFEVATYYIKLGSDLHGPPGEIYANVALARAIREGRVQSGAGLKYEIIAAH